MKAESTCARIIIIFVSTIFIGLSAGTIYGSGFPHYLQNEIECESCHYVHGDQPSLLPEWTAHSQTDIDDTQYNTLCRSCHIEGSTGTPQGSSVETHSSLQAGENYGKWTVQCIVCHDPHFQVQSYTYTNPSDYLYLGTVSGLTSTTITATPTPDPLWTADDFSGMIVIPDVIDQLYTTYKIVGNTGDTLTVAVPMDTSLVQDGDTFAIGYGKLIKSPIILADIGTFDSNGDPVVSLTGSKPVKFVRPTGNNSFADGDNVYNGICEVCHTQTTHFRNDGSGDDQLHTNIGGTIGKNCINCHSHSNGFIHGSGSGNCVDCHNSNKHPVHLDQGAACSSCHDTNNMRDGNGNIIVPPIDKCKTCHQDGNGNDPNDTDYYDNWNQPYDLSCDSCHNGRPGLDTTVMSNDGHERLVGEAGIRQYPCYYCHDESVDSSWKLLAKHANGTRDVAVNAQWEIVDQAPPALPTYDPVTQVCSNIYCHTDGTIVDPEMRPYPWSGGPESCNSCHGHDPAKTDCTTCHPGGKTWDPEQEWLSAMPMYPNSGPGTSRANSHYRHLFTGFSCDDCHVDTVVGGCLTCHSDGNGNPIVPTGTMGDVAHVNGTYHVNKGKTVSFKIKGDYNPATKTCSNTACHELGEPPVWGGSVNGSVTCANCHVTTGPDVDDFGGFNGTPARINYQEWITNGHGRPAASGDYPSSNNPAADFPANGCWYCHDNNVLHQVKENPFRLRRHDHYNKRFDKECVYCHMSEDQVLTGQLDEAQCMDCHNSNFTLAPQLNSIGPNGTVLPEYNDTTRPDHGVTSIMDGSTRCDSTDCHTTNARRHKTDGFKIWSVDDKADVQNQYVMMGVCLKCHDDDSGGECQTCHQGAQYTTGFDPQMAGLSFKKPQTAKASSFHFGYKHYVAYDKSVTTALDTGTVSVDGTTTDELTSAKSWAVDQWEGKSVVMLDGVNKNETRKIASNTDTVLSLVSSFSNPVNAGDSYRIIAPVWKGGKFCWDCHDPHGDRNYNDEFNIYMIQGKVATETDGDYGKPIPAKRRDVVFTRKINGRDYARKDPAFDGICNVCHDDDLSNPDRARHYNRSSGDTHNASRICTTCHEHRFTDSHAGGQNCNSCHQNKPVPRHTAFGQPKDCTKCHDGIINGRMNIMKQLTQSQSHHVQRDDGTVTNKDCYDCHWEATKFGLINIEHHAGYNYKTHDGVNDGAVDLVIWNKEDTPGSGVDTDTARGSRPEVYDLDGSNIDGPGVPTATTFLATDLNYGDVDPAVNMQKERAQVENITPHCLSCHSDQNNEAEPFDDCKTPHQYAWDGNSIDARYSQTGTTTWGKYTAYPNAAQKDLQKSFSAHGKAVDNSGGFAPNTGVDGAITNTRANDKSLDGQAHNVQCYDCHSSHGSFVEGITSSYISFDGEKHGGNLKETQAGYGGYVNNYKATAFPDPTAVNFYNAGAGQCFDCHETRNAGDTTSGSNKAPWGFESTFGAAEPIIGYKENLRFSGGYPGITESPEQSGRPAADSTIDLSYRLTRSTMGGHLNASHNLDPGDSLRTAGYDDTSMNTNVYGSIDGLCSPCHDPHGVSPTMGANQQYGVPLLKGTWLSSPFKEDVTVPDPYGTNVTNFADGTPQSWGKQVGHPTPYQPENARWNIDRTTFGGTDRIAESDSQFAGLCISCHPRSNDDGSANLEDGVQKNTNFRTVDRIHESVKGWGANTEHSYPCSKCHQPHASGLPRLLQTNCLNFQHRGGRLSGGVPWQADKESGSAHGRNEHRGYPIANSLGNSSTYEAGTACHSQAPLNPGADWQDMQLWNGVSPW